MPALFASMAPPGSNVPFIVGSITFGVAVIAAGAAYTARETSRIRLEDLGDPHAVPMAQADYERSRAETRATPVKAI
jgi:hypothetical protein